ncbi:hypothetical protein [Vibrio owensii]|uniref:hypothetical protein n=1 Tax=Vibrio owensii TaxID=696485 RepID=UPI001A7E4A15|nr:hypothetical protein [Vibrio owensii]
MMNKLSFAKGINNYILHKIIFISFPIIVIYFSSSSLLAEDLGKLFISQGIALWVGVIIDFGLVRNGVVGVNSRKINNLFQVVLIQIILLIIISPILFFVIDCFYELNVFDFIFIATYGAINSIIPRWFFQAKMEMLSLSKVEFFCKLSAIVMLFFIELESRHYVQFVLISANILVLIFSIRKIYLMEYFSFTLNDFFRTFLQVLRGRKILVSRLFGNLSLNSTVVIIGAMLLPSQVAVYMIVEKIIKLKVAILSSIGEALYPMVIGKDDRKVYTVAIIISCVISLTTILVSVTVTPYLSSIVFNLSDDYYELIYIMCGSVLFYSLSTVISLFKFVAQSDYKSELVCQIVIGVTSLLITVVLVRYYALLGAAYAYMLSSIISFFIIYVYYKCKK